MDGGAPLSPRVSIIIRARNEGHCLGECIDRIESQTFSDYEILCVYDPRSTDNTLAIAEARGLRIVSLDDRAFSYGRSINLGIAAAQAPYAVLLSAHAFPDDTHWLANLIAPLDKNTNVAGSFSRQIPSEGAHAFWHRELEQTFPEDANAPQVTLSNSSSCIRKSTWREHPFDETLDYAEDLAWANTVQATGAVVSYTPASVVRHSHNETSSQITSRARRERLALHRIGAAHPTAPRQTIVNLIRAMVRDGVECISGREPLSELLTTWRYRRATARGILQGLSQIAHEN